MPRNSARASPGSVLPTRRTRKDERATGTVRILQARAHYDGSTASLHGLVLANNALMQLIFHLERFAVSVSKAHDQDTRRQPGTSAS